MPRTKTVKRKKKLSTQELKRRRDERQFKNKIVSVFKNTGFEYLNTEGVHRRFGLKTGELDYVFAYENIVLICEDTSSASENVKDHLKNKKLLTDEIVKNKPDLIAWLKEKFADKFAKFDSYGVTSYKVFHLYFTRNPSNLTSEDEQLYQPIRVIEYSSLNYFHKMTQNIKYSARNEIFRYLGVNSKDIGVPYSSRGEAGIETTIIYPVDNTGLNNGVRLVSFMMSADKLLNNCYVLRKDNWEDSIQLYQRLIEKARIQSIRQYLAKNKSTFFNNIIVSLPEGITFRDKDGNPANLTDINGFESYKMFIPDEVNSICIIDGQHRIFAHYEGDDGYEKIIKPLRKKLHLLVTGLIFPKAMSNLDRRKYESEIFLDINSNAKPVPPDVLLHIETLKDPFSDVGVARQILVKLNREPVFLNYFQLSLMQTSKIKIASIIKFALKYLVTITEDKGKVTLFNYWDEEKAAKLLLGHDEQLLEDYVQYAKDCLKTYFSALSAVRKDDWRDPDSKILSTTSINGFVMAFRKSLGVYGVKDYQFYEKCFEKLNVDFSKDNFPYTSSQYNKFSKQILEDCFNLIENDDGTITAKP
jgi:DGQHR domain-containing protein